MLAFVLKLEMEFVFKPELALDDFDCFPEPFVDILVTIDGGNLVRLMKPTHQSNDAWWDSRQPTGISLDKM